MNAGGSPARGLLWLVGLCCVLSVAACDGNADEVPARLRAVNASAAPSVDFYENLDLLTRIRIRETSPYLDVEAGTTLLEARPEGDGSTVSVTAQVLLAPDSSYTAVVAGPVDALELLFLTDVRTTPPGGRASIRLLHAATRTGLLDVEIVPDDAEGDTTSVGALAFAERTAYTPLSAGGYTLFIDERNGNGDAAPRIDLAPGRRYLLAVTDAGSDRTLRLIVAEQ